MSTTVLYARSDVCAIAIPATSGGCGAQHLRKVTRGVPEKTFAIDCPSCEAYLRGDGKQKKLVYETDKRTGQAIRQQRVADSDPRFSSTPDTIPQTPDEERVNSVREARGSQQIQMIQALAALRATGIQVPDEAMWLLERELPSGILKGTVLCANGHDNQAGIKFCGECGMSMAARGALGGPDDPGPIEVGPVVDLRRLHVATLRKRCRDAGLPDKGSKDALIGRLQAA